MAQQQLTLTEERGTGSARKAGGREAKRAFGAAREKYEKMVPAAWLDAEMDLVVEVGSRMRERLSAGAAERSDAGAAGFRNAAEYNKAARRTVLDAMLLDDGRLHGATGLSPTEFFYLAACYEAEIKANPDAPLYRGVDEDRASDRGNRCALRPEHELCMALFRMWTGCAQASLECVFGVDQTTASRGIARVEKTLSESRILPTDRVIMRELSEASRDRALAFVGGVVNMDWTHVEIERPGDSDSNNEAYSHKADATTCKTLVGCSAGGIILLRGPALGGRGSEIEYLRHHLPLVGSVTESLTDEGTPPGERITVNFDGGPRGAAEVLKGANVQMPYRKPPNGELTQDQLDYNSWQAGERAIIENNFADIKTYRIVRNVFRGSVAELEDAFTIIVGIANLKRMAREASGRPPNTHRKTLKPGPKKPGPRGRKPRETFKTQD